MYLQMKHYKFFNIFQSFTILTKAYSVIDNFMTLKVKIPIF